MRSRKASRAFSHDTYCSGDAVARRERIDFWSEENESMAVSGLMQELILSIVRICDSCSFGIGINTGGQKANDLCSIQPHSII